MKLHATLLILGLLGACAVGAMMVHSAPPITSVGPSVEDWAELRTEILALKEQNEFLIEQVQQLRGRPILSAVASDAAAMASLDRAEATPMIPLLEESEPTTSNVANVRDQVRVVFDELKRIEEAEREEQRRQKEKDSLERQLAKVAAKLELTEYQTTSLGNLMRSQQERLAETKARLAGADDALRQEEFAAIRNEMRSAAAQFLSADQVESLSQMLNGGKRGKGKKGKGLPAPQKS